MKHLGSLSMSMALLFMSREICQGSSIISAGMRALGYSSTSRETTEDSCASQHELKEEKLNIAEGDHNHHPKRTDGWMEMDLHDHRGLLEDLVLSFMMEEDDGDFHFDDYSMNMDCEKMNMAYDLVDHGIKFDTPKSISINWPKIEERKIPAPIMPIKKLTPPGGADDLQMKRKHLEAKFHLKSPKKVLSILPQKQLVPNVVPVVLVTNEALTNEPKSWEKITQTGHSVDRSTILQIKGMHKGSEFDQQQHIHLLDLPTAGIKNQVQINNKPIADTTKRKEAIEWRQDTQDDSIGFDAKSNDYATTAMPILGNSAMVRRSLARAASIARNSTRSRDLVKFT